MNTPHTPVSNCLSNACLSSCLRQLFLLLTVLTSFVERHCPAQGTVYTDRSVFNAALLSGTTTGFENVTPSDMFSIGTNQIVTSHITVYSAGWRLFVWDSSPGVPGDGQYIKNYDSSSPVLVFLPSGKNAFAADFVGNPGSQNNPFNATITVGLVGGQPFTYNFGGPVGSWTFRGFVFPSAISSVTFDDGGSNFPGSHGEALDNATYGVAVPEPRSSLLLLLGLFSTCAFLRSRKQGAED